ncbi:MAG: dockerin type I domain-containing protein [Dehalococcoidia bacterium]
MTDLLVESRAINRHSTNPLYDVNHDGKVNYADLLMIAQQLGRRCTR